MHPVLFEIPVFPAWIAAVAIALLGAVFGWFGRKDPKDKGSWALAGACGVAAVWILLAMGAGGSFGPLPIRFFGILVVLGFLAAAKVMAWRNERLGLLTGEESFDLAFFMLIAGLIGARAFHVLQNTDTYAGHPVEMLKVWDGGLVWYGGAFASTFYAWYWLAKRKKDVWAVTDTIGLAVPVGHAVGRLGCFMAGCDYGKVVEGGRESVPWAVHFPTKDPYTLVPMNFRYDAENDRDLYIHPAQLYEALGLLVVFAILWFVDRKMTKGAFRGRLAALYCMLYAVERGVVEIWRGDADRGVYFGGTVSFSQILSGLFFVGGVMMYQALKGRSKTPATA